MMMRQAVQKRVNRSTGGDVGIFIFLAVGGLFMFLPVLFIISNAFKPLDEIWIFPPKFIVRNPTLKNFQDLFIIFSYSTVPFTRYLFNSIMVSVVGTAGHVVIASLCAYALSKHPFPGAKIIFNIIVLSLMFNAAVTNVPNFIIMAKLGLIDNNLSLIIPAFAAPLGLYLMKQFIDQMIPDSLLESARMDGANEWRIFWKIVMPIVKPAWLTLTLFSFQALWAVSNTPFIRSEYLKTLTYALNQIMGSGLPRAGVGSAASLLLMAVPVFMFILTQSMIVETMSTSGMKE